MTTWREASLGDPDVASIDRGVSWGKADEIADGIPVVGIPQLRAGAIRYEASTVRLPEALARKKLIQTGDILLVGSSGSMKNVGRSALVAEGDPQAAFASFVARVRAAPSVCTRFLWLLMRSSQVDFERHVKKAADGKFNLQIESLRKQPIRLPPLDEQQAIARTLGVLDRALGTEECLAASSRELKWAASAALFSRGLRSVTLKDTALGALPQTWDTVRLELCCDVTSSSMSYTDLAAMTETADDVVIAMGVKVSDMNRPGNERRFAHAALEKRVPAAVAKRRMIPSNTVVFPKRGAAIATNKKRLTTTWTVLDPNLIGVRPQDRLTASFLYHWFERFDLRTITEPGPTPQLNKKNLVPLLVPVPSDLDEQRDIAHTLDTIDRKIDLHERKRATLQELFDTLLHDLMTGRLRVDALAPDALAAA